MSNSGRTALTVVGVLVVALIGGVIGARFLAGDSASASGVTAPAPGAFLDAIKQRGELRVGVAIAAPMTVQAADGTLGGPNLIPLEDLAAQLGVKVTPVAAEWKDIVAGLQAGRYDFAANLDATVQRAVAIEFTDPVYEYQGVFLVKADSPYTTVDDLKAAGQPIAAAQGSAPEAALKGLGFNVLSIDTYANAVAALNADRVIAEFADLPTVEAQAQADPAFKIIVPDPAIYSADAAYGVPADADARSLQAVNIAIARARSSGRMAEAYAAVDYFEQEHLPADLVKQ